MEKKKIKVLFVCLGNICRSPLAEAIFKDKVRRRNLDVYIEADSCGTANYHIGHSPDERTIRNALKNGVSIDHLGRQLADDDLDYYDFILVMDHSNHRNVLRLKNAEKHQHKISLMRVYDNGGVGKEVPDPYYGSEHDFQEVFDILDRSTEQFIQHLEENHVTKFKA